jgi:DNA-binding transcriptional LysR family regulator
MNFRQLDLNLLRVLCAIHRTGSVTEAGRQLALSQSATSNALARLRHGFGDALFVRSPTGLHPTRLTQRVAPLVEAHLRELESALCLGEDFDPAGDCVHWRVSLSDLGEMMFLPPLARVLREAAPGCRLSNESIDAGRVSAALEAREIDLAVGMLLPEHQGVVAEQLFHERYVAVSGPRWQPDPPCTGRRLGRAQLARAPLAVAAPSASLLGTVQRILQRLDIGSPPTVRLRHYGAIPDLVADTDLVAVVPQMFADAMAGRQDLQAWDLPEEAGYDVRMVWHRSVNDDPAQRWLREQVRRLFGAGTPGAPGDASAPGTAAADLG